MDYRKEYEKWCSAPYIDDRTKEELLALSDEKEIEDRFYRNLEFGTGGLRGVIGAGTNRMNIYTVRLATQGLADYILACNGADRGVVIAYDSRRMSPEFSREAALVLNANGIKTYRFESLRPTPELSFAVRELKCIAGIVVTASHNPREYNGYKVYWEDGAQITPPHDKNILEAVAAVTDISQVKVMSKAEARKAGLYKDIGEKIDDAYIREVKKQSIHPDVIREMAGDFTIVYTPFNGTGNKPVRRILKELGFEKVHVVREQEAPDGEFPTLPYPNPEAPEAWELALSLAKKVDADIVLATDPDADRLGVYCKGPGDGEYIPFTGNMSGMIIAEYILSQLDDMGVMPTHPALVETIVTTDMAKPVAKNYGVDIVEVLTGFKYIGEQIRLFEENQTYHYIFGLEESYGCLAGTYARDKDACVAVMLLCEAAAFYKQRGWTLWDAMCDMYERYGYFREGLYTLTLSGKDGEVKRNEMMDTARNNPPVMLAGKKVIAVRDYLSDVRRETESGSESFTGLPRSNVLYYELEDDFWCCIRPSGTEPKIKYYFGVKGKDLADADRLLQMMQEEVIEIGGER